MGKKFLSPYFALTIDFLDSDAVYSIMKFRNGPKYILLFERLCIMAAKRGGRLSYQFNGSEIPYPVDRIQREAKLFPLAIVKMGLYALTEVGLLEYDEEKGIYFIPKIEEFCREEEE